jgi:ribonuclease J
LKDTTLKPAQELLFCALGGSGEIGMNVNLYGCDGKWLMADLGMTFSGNEYPGIDLVFADLEFIEQRRKDLLGIVLTHAHEDHIGAVPYFAADLGVPLYATPFTAKLVAAKLDEAGLLDTVELIEIDHLDRFAIGPFGIRYVPLAHSIAEGNALLIDTPYGKIFHTGDWKLDEEPLIGQPATPDELRRIGDEGVLALVCDSTNVFNPEPSGSEGDVARGLRGSRPAQGQARAGHDLRFERGAAPHAGAGCETDQPPALRLGPFARPDHRQRQGLRLSGQAARPDRR